MVVASSTEEMGLPAWVRIQSNLLGFLLLMSLGLHCLCEKESILISFISYCDLLFSHQYPVSQNCYLLSQNV